MEIYTDGAYSFSKDQMGIGVAVIDNGKLKKEYSRMIKGGTNNIAELLAIITALRCIKEPVQSVTIISDSMYCIGTIIKGWKRNKNTRMWKRFDEQYEYTSKLCSNIEFKHIKGHNGNEWNEYCDFLATSASNRI